MFKDITDPNDICKFLGMNELKNGDEAMINKLLSPNAAVGKFCQGCKKAEKWLEPWQMGIHLKVLREGFPLNTNMTGFRWF